MQAASHCVIEKFAENARRPAVMDGYGIEFRQAGDRAYRGDLRLVMAGLDGG